MEVHYVAWVLLIAAGAVEIVMVMALESAHGWTRLGSYSALAAVASRAGMIGLHLLDGKV